MPADTRLLANAIRALSMDAVQAANSGHPGMPMGMADAATVLFAEYLKHDPADPAWPDRDRFVLSAGHGSMLLYALLHLTGYARPTMDEIKGFRSLGSPCAGHPENFLLDGVEATTGPLGQGFAMAVGMAIAERHLNAEYGHELVDHRTWVIASDGDLMEGVNHEAAGLAGHLKLGRLIVLFDDNKITIDGSTALSTSEHVVDRYRAYGWHTLECDGHDVDAVRRAIDAALTDPRPSLIACRTIIGYGAPSKQGTAATHGAALGPEEVAAARVELHWEHPPFELPQEILDAWRAAGSRGRPLREAWEARLASDTDRRARFHSGQMGAGDQAAAVLEKHISALASDPKPMATRKASELALEHLTVGIPQMIGGSADLTGSNNTKTKAQKPLTQEDYSGRYIYYGIREFGMAAAMNGMALHGGIIPYGGTFLIFTDYCRPAIRLSALQQVQVIYVMTHDSIGLGEDGPTHQPIEHLVSLRAMPNVHVFRPADAIETAECWALSLGRFGGPSVLALTRQNVPLLRGEGDGDWSESDNRCARGAYRLRAASAPRQVVLLATGSEVSVAVEIADALEGRGIGADVVSMPCWELFDEQDASYRHDLLPEGVLLVSIEAAATLGWERYTGRRGLNIGLDRFGASAPAEDLFRHFGFTAEAIVPLVTAALESQGF